MDFGYTHRALLRNQAWKDVAARNDNATRNNNGENLLGNNNIVNAIAGRNNEQVPVALDIAHSDNSAESEQKGGNEYAPPRFFNNTKGEVKPSDELDIGYLGVKNDIKLSDGLSVESPDINIKRSRTYSL